jgi:type II secretory pathway component GspD/PulD (secretin)
VVVSLHEVRAERAAAIIRGFYPGLRIRTDANANAVIAVAPPDEADAIRTILQGLDVRDPSATAVDAEPLRFVSPSLVVPRLHAVFPLARFFAAPNHTLITVASPDDLQQIKAVIGAIDTAPQTPTPRPQYPAEAVRITQRNVRQVALAVAHSAPNVRVAISGSEILLSGPPDDVAHAKDLVAQLDVPQMGVTYTEVYRLRFVEAASVGDLISRSFPSVRVDVDHDLNAVTVVANTTLQERIAEAISTLDVAPPGTPGGAPGSAGPGGLDIEYVTLRAALPGSSGPSTSAQDVAQTVQSVLQQAAPDLRITVPPNSTELILTGSPYAIQLAKGVIAHLDVVEPEVVLDTEILEVDETVAKNLGLEMPSNGALVSTTWQEQNPPAPSGGGTPPPLTGLMPLYRTVPIQFSLELNLAIQNNKARVLSDPRITTFSGHTATIRAGDTISILTTTGGGTGTVATSQVQSFQTGVTLDITPIVNPGGWISVTLHPTVNNEAGVLNGVPQISTRETQTTVGLQDNQTLVIGGLIEDSTSRTVNKIPILGDLPLIGRLFQNSAVNNERNDLIITVTPHIVQPGDGNTVGSGVMRGPALPDIPTPQALPDIPTPLPLPSLDPSATIPPSAPHGRRGRAIPNPMPEPSPIAIPTPQVALTPPPNALAPASAPMVTPSPIAIPSAFEQTNVYTFGSPPSNNYAAPSAAAQIFYAQVQPTVVADGQSLTISAITTTNVVKVVFGLSPVIPEAHLTQLSPGKWQAIFPFSAAALPSTQGPVQMTLTASSAMGATVSVPIPISVLRP